jgi:pilus assembly protein CpaE
VRLNTVRVPLELTAGDVVCEETDEAPFAPPPADDIFGLAECEDEETIFVAEPAPEDDAPFDPPELEEEPFFSAPSNAQLASALEAKPEIAPAQPPNATPRDRPLPAISVHMSWDRAEAQALMQSLAADPRLARAETSIARGGLDGAVARAHAEPADLYLLDTDLDGAQMLGALDRLRAAAPKATIVMLGAVNDIGLLRELAARGVSDYIVPPAIADEVARSLCALFADVTPARVIAVIGARGGIGSSTVARNVAWSIAERQRRRTTLIDLDLCFGSAAGAFGHAPAQSVKDVLTADDPDDALAAALWASTPRLSVLPAPAKTQTLELEDDAFDALLGSARRSAAHIVLDLPHAWEPWVRTALREADEIVIVAGPDLASLRNADNMLKLLRSERDQASAPVVVLSMTGLPKRPEIPLKDFAEALHTKPAMVFGFEPELFAAAEADAKMIYEKMPDSKAALQLDALASRLTGHAAHAQPAQRTRTTPQAEAPEPVLELVTLAPLQPQSNERRMRGAKRSGFIALQSPAPAKKRSTGIVRAIAAMATLAALGAWFVDHQQHRAPAPDIAPTFNA